MFLGTLLKENTINIGKIKSDSFCMKTLKLSSVSEFVFFSCLYTKIS